MPVTSLKKLWANEPVLSNGSYVKIEQLPHEESRKILPIEEDGELFD